MSLKYCLSFDIGGTFIKYGVIDNNGKICFKDKVKTPSFNGRETVPKLIIDIFNSFKSQYDIAVIGISTLGQVNTETGVVEYATENLPDYSNTRFAEIIKEKLNLPCFVDNDVNTAAIGEMWLGSAKGCKNFLCVTLGTGVGGAIVIDSKIHRGSNFSAGEIGHIILFPNGTKCNCGQSGCFERYAATSALVNRYRQELEGNGLKWSEEFDGEYIVENAKRGDELCYKIYNEFLDNISYGLANITHILDLGTIVIGGGISAQGIVFFDEINKRFKKYALEAYHKNTIIKQALLVNDAGIIGAAFNGFKLIGII